ncbi:MAG: ABC transporter substrate-binding protein [Pseudomonadota bacterium]
MRKGLLAFLAAAALAASTSLTDAKTLRVSAPAPINDIDPHGSNSVVRDTIMAGRQIYDPLLEFKDGEPVGRLATEWQQVDDKTWRFTLRDGVAFHDGTSLDAADVKASIERLAKAKGGLARLWTQLDSVETPDAKTVIVKLKESVGPFLRNVALLQIAPSEAIAAANGEYGAAVRLPGTGAFSIESFEPGQALTLKANPNYWGGAPKIDGISFKTIPELTGRVTALLNDEIDVTWGVPDDQIPSLQSNSDVTVSIVPSVLYYYNWFNSSRGPFKDARVRQAMWHAVDVKQVVGDLLPLTGSIGKAPIAETVFGYAPQEPYSYDPELAKKLLAEAGYPQGFSAELKYSQNFGASVDQMALAFVSYWDKIGVKVTPLQQEHAVWTAALRDLDWDMVLATNPSYTEDADYTIGRLYLGENKENGYANPELDKLLLAARRDSDQVKRKELYAKAIKIIWDDAVGIFPSEAKAVYAHRANVTGIQLAPTMAPRFRDAEIK